jgi:alkylation response protein AidB-like acyl-CoA dehydrogenase
MDLSLSGDQRLFADTARRFLKERWPIDEVRRLANDPSAMQPASLAKDMVELGWTALLLDDISDGVSSSGPANLAIIAELCGAALLSAPALPTGVVTYALLRAGTAGADRHEIVEALIEGEQSAAWAVAEPGRWGADAQSSTATPTDGGFLLNAQKTPVQGALGADHLLVSACAPDGLTQFLVAGNAEGVTLTTLETLDPTRALYDIELTDVVVSRDAMVGESGKAEAEVEAQLALAVALQCAETVGATQRALDITLDYVKERKSFGRPIGSYQALKHRLADMLLWLESAKAVTSAAVARVDGGTSGSRQASIAKAYVAEYCPRIVRDCLQLHGGIGFTWEHEIHLYLRRVESDAVLLGSADYHCDRIAENTLFAAAEAKS